MGSLEMDAFPPGLGQAEATISPRSPRSGFCFGGVGGKSCSVAVRWARWRKAARLGAERTFEPGRSGGGRRHAPASRPDVREEASLSYAEGLWGEVEPTAWLSQVLCPWNPGAGDEPARSLI